VIGVCASTVGAVHDTVACALPAVAVTPVGAGGRNRSQRESLADSTPLEIDNPEPTRTPPSVELLAVGSVYDVPPSVIVTMLPEASLVKIAGLDESHRIASSCVSRSLVSGTLDAV